MYLCCSTTVKSKYDWASDLWLQPASASELEKDTVNCGSQLKFIIEEAPVLPIRKWLGPSLKKIKMLGLSFFSKLDQHFCIPSIAKTVSKKIEALFPFSKLFASDMCFIFTYLLFDLPCNILLLNIFGLWP